MMQALAHNKSGVRYGILVILIATVILTGCGRSVTPEREQTKSGLTSQEASSSIQSFSEPETSREAMSSTSDTSGMDSLPENMNVVIESLVKDLIQTLDKDSTRSFKIQECGTYQSYYAAKNLEMKREYYKQAFAPGIELQGVEILMDDGKLIQEGKWGINVSALVSMKVGSSLRQNAEYKFVATIEKTEGTWFCTEIRLDDDTIYDGHSERAFWDSDTLWTPFQFLSGLDRGASLEEQAKYIDQKLSFEYDRLGKATIDGASIDEMHSDMYSRDELLLAAHAVMIHFKNHHPEWKMGSVGYVGDDAMKGWISEDKDRFSNTVLMCFDYTDGENNRYRDYRIFFKKNSAGGWVYYDEDGGWIEKTN